MYIVIEGQDGTGKSTQANLLAEYYQSTGQKVVILEEPDGDLPQAHDLHDLILKRGKAYHLSPLTNVLLFTAARLELWHKIATPVLAAGGIVISARNWWSTLAYQGYGEGVSRHKIIRLTKDLLPTSYVQPTHGLILSTSDAIRKDRFKSRGKSAETFEAKPSAFQQRVNHAYPKIAKDFHLPLIDAAPPVAEVHAAIKKALGIVS